MTDVVLNSFFPDGARLLRWMLPTLWDTVFGPDIRCQMPAVILWGTVIANPTVAIFALIGVLIGSYFGSKCFSLYRNTAKYGEIYLFYGLSFVFFATMNISALLYHCLRPPPMYIHDIGLPIPLNYSLTHFAHVFDICSTGCSCLSFIIGRLYSIHALENWSPRVFLASFAAIFAVSFIGLTETDVNIYGFSTAIPLLGEVLYPGILACTALTAPFLRWSPRDYPALSAAFVMVTLAFVLGVFEMYLCHFWGPHFTAPMWAFFFCDIAFLVVAHLICVV